ncbi:xaa-Pro aminopeptidase 1-like [Glandiceps talaboti]
MAAKNSTALLQKLRNLMKSKPHVNEPLQAYIVPSGDAHQSEYTAACDKRRGFLSGFDGSAGTAVVTHEDAMMWTDSRYFLQAVQQMDQNWALMKHGLPSTPSQEEWLVKVLPEGGRVGVDPLLLSLEQWKKLNQHLKITGRSLVPVNQNLVDLVWSDDKPAPPDKGVQVLDIKYAGVSWQDKITKLRKQMKDKSAEYIVVTALDEIAWLFNLRGSDIEFNPVFFSYAVVGEDSIHLFVDEDKLDKAVLQHLNVNGSENGDGGENLTVRIHPYTSIQTFLASIYEDKENGPRTWISAKSSYGVVSIIPKRRRIIQSSPIVLSKAVKNDIEIDGMRQAHIKDAAALCEAFAWMEKEVPKGKTTEIDVADKCEELRSQQEDYVSLSFATISSIGSDGAIIHYKPSEESNRLLNCNEVFLLDSGAQFRDGTTDITRTMHFGTPSQHEKECYTRMVKGHIALSTAVFPNGTKGYQLDTFARQYLWEAGLDYGHGTGHGVGAYLNVHEGPCNISYHATGTDVALQAGMFLSDEPGYYEDGSFGCRLENVVMVKPIETKHNFNDRGFLTFEPVTLVPIQLKMIEPSLLTEKEISWLNEYHSKCRDIVAPLLEQQGRKEALQWLMKETEPLG